MSKDRGATSSKCIQCVRQHAEEPNSRHSRGLCHKHLKQIKGRIKRKVISERQAIAAGLILPKAQTGPASGRSFATTIARAAGKMKRRSA